VLQKKNIQYVAGTAKLEGYYVFDDTIVGKRPAILVAHDWSGRNEFACQKAERLAELGYVGFALDMFGQGIIGNTKDEKAALIQPLLADRELLGQRMLAALNVVQALDQVDNTRIGAMGFCFGGLCVLDLARIGAKVRGVVSFHGLLNAPSSSRVHPITAKVLVLHGADDPMVSPDVVAEFQDEMSKAGADWQFHTYGNTMHAFTNPGANDPGFGTVYSAVAARRSWMTMKNFFTEIFSET
jgi:dienelactone hydrolase